MSLPRVSATISIEGIHRNDGIYVSDLALSKVHMLEAPLTVLKDFHLGNLSSPYLLGRPLAEECEYIPARADGTIHLSDEEWEKVCPLLNLPTPRLQNTAINYRAVFNDILTKYEADLPWSDVPCTSGKPSRPQTFRTKWKHEGSLAIALDWLRAERR